jgi:hypothetical protein
MNIPDIIKNNPEINLTVRASELQEFALICFEAGKQDKPKQQEQEEYLTPDEMAKLLKISLVTLWSYDKKGITHPYRLGNKKLYKRSDLEKILK